MMWISLSGLIVLTVILALAITFGIALDRLASRIAIVAALFLAMSLVFSNITDFVTDEDVILTFSIFSSVASGMAWFFILVGLVRFASVRPTTYPS